MREILFKAKLKGRNQWIEGFYCSMRETTYCFAEDYERHPVPLHHLIAVDEMTDWGLPNRLRLYEIDPETVCQYTEFQDEEKTGIFENDIVGFLDCTSTESGYAEQYCVGKVVWDEETGAFQVENRLSAESYEVLNRGCKVLGNIFDNPELLEK